MNVGVGVDDEIQPILGALATGAPLGEAASEHAFELLLSGRLDEAQIGALLAMLAPRRITVDEVVGAVRATRRHLSPVVAPAGMVLVDTCGTGGAPKTFNVSTISAIVIAAAGGMARASVPGGVRVGVAKHGNRSRTGRGSAEVLEALGVNIHASAASQARSLREIGICFSFAPDHHPAVRHAGAARRGLGFPTMFNLIGPLASPAGITRQVVGAWSHGVAEVLAQALTRLGAERAIVTSSEDGLDELTTTAVNRAYVVEAGAVTPRSFAAPEFGLAASDLGALRVGSVEEAARAANEILEDVPGPRRDMVLLTAGAGLFVAGAAPGIGEGIELARGALASGAARRTLAELVRISRKG